jgi:hypothetical protein
MRLSLFDSIENIGHSTEDCRSGNDAIDMNKGDGNGMSVDYSAVNGDKQFSGQPIEPKVKLKHNLSEVFDGFTSMSTIGNTISSSLTSNLDSFFNKTTVYMNGSDKAQSSSPNIIKHSNDITENADSSAVVLLVPNKSNQQPQNSFNEGHMNSPSTDCNSFTHSPSSSSNDVSRVIELSQSSEVNGVVKSNSVATVIELNSGMNPNFKVDHSNSSPQRTNDDNHNKQPDCLIN